MQTELLSLLVIAVIAAAAPLIAGIPRTVRVPVVVVEILAGILVGPHVLDLVSTGEVVTFLSATGLAFLFFLAGMEIDFLAIRGKPATLGLWGWIISLGLALAIAGVLQATGFVLSTLLIGVALSTTAIGTLMPILRDAGELDTPLGPFTLAAGVAGEFGPILAISLLLSEAAGPGVNAMLLIAFAVVTVGLGVLASAGPSRPGRHDDRAHDGLERPVCGAARDPDPDGAPLPDEPFRARRGARRVRRRDRGRSRDEERGGGAGPGQARGHRLRLPDPDLLRRQRRQLRPAGAASRASRASCGYPSFLPCSSSSAGRRCWLLYRKAIPRADRWPLVLTSATALPLVVAVTQIGLAEGRMLPENAAALVGAGMVSVLLFPMLALQLRGRRLVRNMDAAAQEGFESRVGGTGPGSTRTAGAPPLPRCPAGRVAAG